MRDANDADIQNLGGAISSLPRLSFLRRLFGAKEMEREKGYWLVRFHVNEHHTDRIGTSMCHAVLMCGNSVPAACFSLILAAATSLSRAISLPLLLFAFFYSRGNGEAKIAKRRVSISLPSTALTGTEW